MFLRRIEKNRVLKLELVLWQKNGATAERYENKMETEEFN